MIGVMIETSNLQNGKNIRTFQPSGGVAGLGL